MTVEQFFFENGRTGLVCSLLLAILVHRILMWHSNWLDEGRREYYRELRKKVDEKMKNEFEK